MPKGIRSYKTGSKKSLVKPQGPVEGPNAPKGNKKVAGNVSIVGDGKAKGSGGPKAVSLMNQGVHHTTD